MDPGVGTTIGGGGGGAGAEDPAVSGSVPPSRSNMWPGRAPTAVAPPCQSTQESKHSTERCSQEGVRIAATALSYPPPVEWSAWGAGGGCTDGAIATALAVIVATPAMRTERAEIFTATPSRLAGPKTRMNLRRR